MKKNEHAKLMKWYEMLCHAHDTDRAAWKLHQGVSVKDAAKLMGVCRATARRWLLIMAGQGVAKCRVEAGQFGPVGKWRAVTEGVV